MFLSTETKTFCIKFEAQPTHGTPIAYCHLIILLLQAEMEKNCMFKQQIALDGHDLRPLPNICYLPDPYPLPTFKTKYEIKFTRDFFLDPNT